MLLITQKLNRADINVNQHVVKVFKSRFRNKSFLYSGAQNFGNEDLDLKNVRYKLKLIFLSGTCLLILLKYMENLEYSGRGVKKLKYFSWYQYGPNF